MGGLVCPVGASGAARSGGLGVSGGRAGGSDATVSASSAVPAAASASPPSVSASGEGGVGATGGGAPVGGATGGGALGGAAEAVGAAAGAVGTAVGAGTVGAGAGAVAGVDATGAGSARAQVGARSAPTRAMDWAFRMRYFSPQGARVEIRRGLCRTRWEKLSTTARPLANGPRPLLAPWPTPGPTLRPRRCESVGRYESLGERGSVLAEEQA
jgi:hypothetical protein